MEKESELLQAQVGVSPRIGRNKGKLIADTSHTASAATKLMIDPEADRLGYIGGQQSEFMTLDQDLATERDSKL